MKMNDEECQMALIKSGFSGMRGFVALS